MARGGVAPDRASGRGGGRRIIDLSQPLGRETQLHPFFPSVQILRQIVHSDAAPGKPSFSAEVIVTSNHAATHVDSFAHYDASPNAPRIAEMPLETFCGEAVCVDVREYLVTGLDQLEGHSGIVNNPYARSVVERTIRDHAVPAETRSVAQVKLASVASRLVEEYVSGLESVAGLGLASAAVASSVGAGEGLPTAELIDHAPEEAAMVRAALGLRQPFPLRLLRILLEAAFE